MMAVEYFGLACFAMIAAVSAVRGEFYGRV
jgi:hypothetical protein